MTPIVTDFFGTICSEVDHAPDEGHTIPSCIICSNSFLATRRRSGAWRVGLAETGRLFVSIWWVTSCVTALSEEHTWVSWTRGWGRGHWSNWVRCMGLRSTDTLNVQVSSGIHKLVLLHISISTSSPKLRRKSAPRIGFCTSAMTKIHGNDRLRLRVRDRLPYVEMGVSFTAMRVSLSGGCLQSEGEDDAKKCQDPCI